MPVSTQPAPRPADAADSVTASVVTVVAVADAVVVVTARAQSKIRAAELGKAAVKSPSSCFMQVPPGDRQVA